MKAKPKIYNVPEIMEYEDDHEIKISDEKKRNIQNQLQVRKESFFSASQRLQQNQPFMKFSSNPFSSIKHKQHSFSKFPSTKPSSIKTPKSKNIIESAYEMRHKELKPKPEFMTHIQQIAKSKYDLQFFSNKVGNLQAEQNKKKNVQTVMKKLPVLSEPVLQKEVKLVDIDIIMKIDDENFFNKKNKQINIFQCGRNQSAYRNSEEQLQVYQFNFNAIVEKIANIKIPIKRQISRMGRKIIQNIPIKEDISNELDSIELSFKSTRLIAGDVFNLASGRFTHEFLSSLTEIGKNINKGDDFSSEEGFEEDIIYEPNYFSKKDLFNLKEAAEQREIEEFKNTEFKEREKKVQRNCLKKKNYIQNLFKEEKYLDQNTIFDKESHLSIEKKINYSVNDFLPQNNIKDLDRIIRKNKSDKTRDEGIELKNFLSTLKSLNQYEEYRKNINRTLS